MIAKPYLLFVGDAPQSVLTKTAQGVRQWVPEDCVAQWRLAADAIDLDLPDLDPSAAFAAGARSLLIGIAPVGGALPADWITPLTMALEAGLDIVSGLHTRLAEHPQLSAVAARCGRTIHDVRHSTQRFPAASGRKRSGKRLLTVGTDCALGKKYTALAVAAGLRARGVAADFRATGQTGIMIAGAGIAIDAVVADFVAGAAETLSPDADPTHWDVIEGQGAIFHPAYAGVTLGLLHGSQPDVLVLCHDPVRRHFAGWPDIAIPPLAETLDIYLRLGRVTNPGVRFAGVALNTFGLDETEAHRIAAEIEAETALVVCDPLRFGLDRLIVEVCRA